MIKKFNLGGREFNIECIDSIDDTGLGRAYETLNKIKVAKTWMGSPIPESSLELIIMHEVLHCMLDSIGEHTLSGDEKFVESLSILLHQFYKSAEE